MVGTPTRPRAQGYNCQIGEQWFRVTPTSQAPINIYTQDSLAERQDNRANPEENVLDLGYAFSQSNFSGGEGLDLFPRPLGETRRDTDPIRFWDSSNLEIRQPSAGRRHALALVEDNAVFLDPATAATDAGASDTAWHYIGGDTVFKFNDFANTTADDTDDLNDGTLIQIAVSPDDSVAVLTTSGDVWYKQGHASAYLKVYDATADGDAAQAIWLVKGRIIAACRDTATAKVGKVRTIEPVIEGTPSVPTEGATVISDLDTYLGTMTDCIDAGHAIVASFTDGSLRSYVPQVDAAGGTPDLTIRARVQVPTGEAPFALGHNLGHLLVFTIDIDADHLRVYSGQVLDDRFDFAVGGMQLLRTWEGAVQTVPDYTFSVASTRDEMFFFIEEDTDTQNIWKYSLTTGGLFRHAGTSDVSSATAVFQFADRIAWVSGGDIKTTVPDSLVLDGYLITPNISFGLNTAINWTSFTVEGTGLTGSSYVEFYRTTNPDAILNPDHADWVLIQTLTAEGHSGVEQSKVNITANTLALMVRLHAVEDEGPEVIRFAVRGIPGHRDWIAEVPINVSDVVTAPGRRSYLLPYLGEQTHADVLNLSGKSTTLTLLDPPISLNGVVNRIVEPTVVTTGRGSQAQVCVVQFRGSRVISLTEEGQQVGDFGVGIGGVGIANVGVFT